MNPIKIIRKLGKALRGGATFSQVFLGVLLGFAIGMMPGISLSFIILFALLMLLNVNGGVAAIALILGKIICLIISPVTFNIGYILIHSLGLEGLVKALGDTPVLALLDLHVYCLTGAIPVIIILGGALAFFTAKFFVKFQEATKKAGEENERYQKIMSNKAMKAVLWLAFGGKKKAETDSAEKNKGLIKKGRIIAGIAATAIICILSYLYLDTIAKHGIKLGIESMTGAEVDVSGASLSLMSGRLEVDGLQVTDPAMPENNQFESSLLVADIDVAAMLTRRFVADEIVCNNVKTGSKRSSPGEVYIETEKKTEEPLPEGLGSAQKVKMYYEKVKDIKEKIQKLNEFLDSNDPNAESAHTGPDDKPLTLKERLKKEAELKGYLKLSAKDSLSKHPSWLIRKITVNQLEVNPQLPTMIVEGKNISSAPSLVEEKRSIIVKPDKESIKKITGNLGGGITDSIKEKTGDIGTKIKGLFGK